MNKVSKERGITMKYIEKEQVMYAMLKGIEQEKSYSKWFKIAMEEMFSDTADRERWMLELDKAIKVYDTEQELLREDIKPAILRFNADDEYSKGDKFLKEIYSNKDRTPEQIQNDKDMEEMFGYKVPNKIIF